MDTSRRAQLRKFELIALGGGEGGVGGRPERPPFTAGDAKLIAAIEQDILEGCPTVEWEAIGGLAQATPPATPPHLAAPFLRLLHPVALRPSLALRPPSLPLLHRLLWPPHSRPHLHAAPVRCSRRTALGALCRLRPSSCSTRPSCSRCSSPTFSSASASRGRACSSSARPARARRCSRARWRRWARQLSSTSPPRRSSPSSTARARSCAARSSRWRATTRPRRAIWVANASAAQMLRGRSGGLRRAATLPPRSRACARVPAAAGCQAAGCQAAGCQAAGCVLMGVAVGAGRRLPPAH